MTTPSGRMQCFFLPSNFQGRAVQLGEMSSACTEAMVAFARGLPEQDLLFLDRDIVEPAVVDQWVQDVSSGRLVTIVGWLDETIVGYATLDRGSTRWTRHVAELRVVVAEPFRGIGLGRWLLELVFETALEAGVTKLVARMTPDQAGALNMFQRLGFEQEAVLRDHAMDANGVTHDLLVLSFHTHQHPDSRCGCCGAAVLAPLVLDGERLCSHCYETRYEELGGGD